MPTRGFRTWCAERGRARFVLTLALVVGLTLTCGALVLLPTVAHPGTSGARAAAAEVTPDDPRLVPVRRTMEPFGDLVIERFPTGPGKESLVVGHEAQRPEIAVLGAELAPSAAAIADLLGRDWSRATVIVVAANPSEFAALVKASSILPGEVAAVTVTDPFTPGTQPTAQRVVFSPEAGRRLSPDQLRTLLRHELTHVATRAETADGAPAWMLEGFAEYAAHRATPRHFAETAPTVTAHIRSGTLPADLPAPQDMTGPHAAEAYESAWTACAFIAEKYGEKALVTLYHHLAAAPTNPEGENKILAETLHTPRQELITQWRAWLATKAT